MSTPRESQAHASPLQQGRKAKAPPTSPVKRYAPHSSLLIYLRIMADDLRIMADAARTHKNDDKIANKDEDGLHDSTSRRTDAIAQAWTALNAYLSELERRATEARASFASVVRNGGGLVLPGVPRALSFHAAVDGGRSRMPATARRPRTRRSNTAPRERLLASSGEEMLELGDDRVLEPEDDEDYEPSDEDSDENQEDKDDDYEDEDESFDENQEDHDDEDDGSYEDYDEALEHEHSDKNHQDHDDDSSSPLSELSDEHESLGASSHGRDLDVSMDLGCASTRPQVVNAVSDTFPYGCATPERMRSPSRLDKLGYEQDGAQRPQDYGGQLMQDGAPLVQDAAQFMQDYRGQHDVGQDEDEDADADGISDDGEWVAADA
ncbi:hypothetical protein PLICRDRAFT_176802 [Plicaturopsis crispa FD-325 SS-3]|nr:hypothetical protein PLICRDRAFT_176802 [Plicaturopsis crispa FD-325 SS-3]